MTSIPYNRGRPNKNFGSLKIEKTTIESLGFDRLFTAINNNSKDRNINIIDEESSQIIVKSGSSNISIGVSSGTISQSDYAISIGTLSGTNNQKEYGIAIGYNSGNISQGQHSISIGTNSGYCNQKNNCISIGNSSGQILQDINSIAIGHQAGYCNQGESSISIGFVSGHISQRSNSISIGNFCGYCNQQQFSIAIGFESGYINQNEKSIAIGNNVGGNNLGKNSIVIGNNIVCQPNNTIVINPTQNEITANTNGLYIGGITNIQEGGSNYFPLIFNPETSQVIYDTNLNVNKIITIVGERMYGLQKKVDPTQEDKDSKSKYIKFPYTEYTTACIYEVISAPLLISWGDLFTNKTYSSTDQNGVSYGDYATKNVPKSSITKIIQPDITNNTIYFLDTLINPTGNTRQDDWHYTLEVIDINTILRYVEVKITPTFDNNPAYFGSTDIVMKPLIIQTQFYNYNDN